MMVEAQHGFNAVNRGVYIADNLPFLKSLNSECIDLITIDPPFAKNETWEDDKLKPPLSAEELDNELRLLKEWGIANAAEAEQAGVIWPVKTPEARTRRRRRRYTGGGYDDIWSWEKDIHESWLRGNDGLEKTHPSIATVIDTAAQVHSDSIAAYLCFMAVRLIEIHRVLKPTGSLYLHCDHTANGYLRELLDALFGDKSIITEIVWGYGTPSGGRAAGNRPVKTHDTIFAFAKNHGRHQYHRINLPYDPDYVRNWFRNTDEDGRQYMTRSRKGGIVRQYLDESPGVPLSNTWTDIKQIYGSQGWFPAKQIESTGYPTQKPVALAERILEISTNENDVVLDCFAGCAYTAVAAERLGRRWIACDLNPRAWTVVKRQFAKPQLVVLDCNDQTTGQQVLNGNPMVTVHGPGQLPARTSPIEDTQPQPIPRRERTYKVPASIIPEPEMLEELLKLSGYMAWCCGYANRLPDGTVVETTRNFHLDHINPASKEGTSNDIQNRAPLCPYHNIRKNNRRIGLAEYRLEIANDGEMLVNSLSDLINLDRAQAEAMNIYGRAYARKYPSETPQ